MFPSIRHRLVILAAIVVGALTWLLTGGSLVAPEGTSGISLLQARTGVIVATALVVVAGLPAIVAGVLTSGMGNPLAGVFTFGTALSVLAWWGGSINGWMDRSPLPGGYRGLIGETIIWFALVALLLLLIERLRAPLRERWRGLALDDHLGFDVVMALPRPTAIVAGLVASLASGALAFFLLRATGDGQVIVSLFVSFTIGAMVGQLLFPQQNPVGVLMSPAVVAVAAYAFVAFKFGTREDVLAGMYQASLPLMERVPGLALALPIHYASAGLAGAAAGVGLAQVFLHGEQAAVADAA